MKCLLLDIEMPIGKVCPSAYNEDDFKCHIDCGCADNPELINEKVRNWESLKRDLKKVKKESLMELEKIGTRTVCGTYIIEGNLAYIEQEEKGKVNVVIVGGIMKTVPINELDKFIKTYDMHDDIRKELDILASKIVQQCK